MSTANLLPNLTANNNNSNNNNLNNENDKNNNLIVYIELDPKNSKDIFCKEISNPKQLTFQELFQTLQNELLMTFPTNSNFILNYKIKKSFSLKNSLNFKKKKSIPASVLFFNRDQEESGTLQNSLQQNTQNNGTNSLQNENNLIEREFIAMDQPIISLQNAFNRKFYYGDNLLDDDDENVKTGGKNGDQYLYLEMFPNCSPQNCKMVGNFIQTICKNETLFNFQFLLNTTKDKDGTGNTGSANSTGTPTGNASLVSGTGNNHSSANLDKKKKETGSIFSPITVRSEITNTSNNNLFTEMLRDKSNVNILFEKQKITKEEYLQLVDRNAFLTKAVKIPLILRICFEILKGNNLNKSNAYLIKNNLNNVTVTPVTDKVTDKVTDTTTSDDNTLQNNTQNNTQQQQVIIPNVCIEGIFRHAGSKNRIENLIKKFNSILAFPYLFPNGIIVNIEGYETMYIIADIIKRFLRELPDCLLTFDKYEEWMELFRDYNNTLQNNDENSLQQSLQNGLQQNTQNNEEFLQKVKKLIQSLPEENQLILNELLKLLKIACIDFSHITKLTPKTMAIVMGTNLLFVPKKEKAIVVNDLKRMSIRNHLQTFQSAIPVICNICEFLIENVNQLEMIDLTHSDRTIENWKNLLKEREILFENLKKENADILQREEELKVELVDCKENLENIQNLLKNLQFEKLKNEKEIVKITKENETLQKSLESEKLKLKNLEKENLEKFEKLKLTLQKEKEEALQKLKLNFEQEKLNLENKFNEKLKIEKENLEKTLQKSLQQKLEKEIQQKLKENLENEIKSNLEKSLENTLQNKFNKQKEQEWKEKEKSLTENITKRISLETEKKVKTDLLLNEINPLNERIKYLEEELHTKVKQFYHQALLNMKLVLKDVNFDIPELIHKALQENVPEEEMNLWITKQLNLN
ncbi:hypothetical protein ABK040_002168 [Willaertia magna]